MTKLRVALDYWKLLRRPLRCGVDYIQLREKDLPPSELEILAREASPTEN